MNPYKFDLTNEKEKFSRKEILAIGPVADEEMSLFSCYIGEDAIISWDIEKRKEFIEFGVKITNPDLVWFILSLHDTEQHLHFSLNCTSESLACSQKFEW